jgi:hypothetical protein
MKKMMTIILLSTAIMACKAHKDAGVTSSGTQTKVVGSTTGTVSHKFKATGCETVILVKQNDAEMTLIPKDKLDASFDQDGLVILFNYRTLKMPNPAGCNEGMPAEITDISKK